MASQKLELTQVERFLMLDKMIHPEMTLEEFHERHGITYEKPEHDDD